MRLILETWRWMYLIYRWFRLNSTTVKSNKHFISLKKCVANDDSFEVKWYHLDDFIWFRLQFNSFPVINQLRVMVCYILVAIILFMNTIVCESCDSLYLNKWTGTCPTFWDIPAPGNVSKSLSTCARWCIENPSCMMLSWSPGLCW